MQPLNLSGNVFPIVKFDGSEWIVVCFTRLAFSKVSSQWCFVETINLQYQLNWNETETVKSANTFIAW